MREIKFRAWDKESERMAEWEKLMFDKRSGETNVCFYTQHDLCGSWVGGADYVLLQFTGLTD